MYKCPKCNIVFERKYNLIRHQNKKFDCVQINTLKIKKSEEAKFENEPLHKFAQICTNLHNLNNLSNLNSSNILISDNYKNELELKPNIIVSTFLN